MAKVGIVMGSDSDLEIMGKAAALCLHMILRGKSKLEQDRQFEIEKRVSDSFKIKSLRQVVFVIEGEQINI